jgi:hypothetical protein
MPGSISLRVHFVVTCARTDELYWTPCDPIYL